METTINNQEQLRAAVTTLNASVIGMCNNNSIEDIVQKFTDAKDLLIAIYKYNVLLAQQETKH